MKNSLKTRLGLDANPIVQFRPVTPSVTVSHMHNTSSLLLGIDKSSPFDSERINDDLVSLDINTKKNLSLRVQGYDLENNFTEEQIINYAISNEIFVELDVKDIDALCRMHFQENISLLSNKVLGNLFFIRNITNVLSVLKIVSIRSISYSVLLPLSPERTRFKGQRIFLLSR